MATVDFYEKPGCLNNTRQKQMLVAAGHEVIAHNLLTEPWQKPRLRAFFGDKPVSEWFNASAPAVKNGEVNPGQLQEDEALALMLANPLLIRRPLLQVGEVLQVGFDPELVHAWIGLDEPAQAGDMETCTRPAASACRSPS